MTVHQNQIMMAMVNNVCEVNDMLHNMSTTDIDNSSVISAMCSNCGKEGSDVTNSL